MRGKLSLSVSILALICCNAAQAQRHDARKIKQQWRRRNSGGDGGAPGHRPAEDRDFGDGSERRSASEQGRERRRPAAVHRADVTIDNFGQGIDFDIRGIGKGEHNSQTTPGVITYRDGVATFPATSLKNPITT